MVAQGMSSKNFCATANQGKPHLSQKTILATSGREGEPTPGAAQDERGAGAGRSDSTSMEEIRAAFLGRKMDAPVELDATIR